MGRELKLAAILSALLLMLLGPTALYLTTFHGLAGEVIGSVGTFILLPATALHRALGSTWYAVALGVVAQYAWFMAWVVALRWYYLRTHKADKPA